MKIKFQYKIAVLVAFAGLQGAHAQKKDENIGTEVVNVVKPYTPTISDAFKIKETPVIEDEKDAPKEEIKYNIFSFPVASTFAPAKGKAAAVDKEAREKLFNNYATLGLGNYGTINAELFVTQNLNDGQYVGGMLRHLSSQGGIKDVLLDDKYYNTGLDLTYGSRQQDYNWNTDLGYQHQVYNWYGLPLEFRTFDEATVNSIDEQQTYHTFYIGGKVTTKDSFFHEASAQYKRFWDAFGSAENRFFIKPSFDVDVASEKVKVDIIADYAGGDFEKNYYTNDDLTYSNFNLGVQPSILFQQGDVSVQLGAGVFYSMGKINDNKDNKFFIYPQIKASYKLVGDLLVAYGGAEGGLKQNSYADFVSQNPFVSPTLPVMPTNQQYDIYVGLKGKVAEGVAYNIRGSYQSEDDRAFFVNNNALEILPDRDLKGYSYGNSFGLVYDKLKTVSFFGELKANLSKKIAFGINGTYSSYSTDQAEAWNLPEIKVGASLDADITQKWYAGVNVFFVGDRKDRIGVTDVTDPTLYTLQTVTLDNYFDLNAHAGYKYSDRLTGFLKLNNIIGQDYQKWLNYPVQGFQFLLGASYKFNF
ncbi:TonB-dependent receptor [Flavobacterium sp. Sd200]|uniref:TonB-dependent receptor n=1 Tax=Flavobacterium sp. Sd200 TaxID=2692211 RepID=UPI0013721DD0|nr:TonB-dependent receptor [Flavobacterium sp. Sd200]MXN92398.1 TonB-dependent receptor [Flavobacterium sp. Sd200]